MKVLVTGAGGFIGGHLCTALEQQGAEVIGIGRTPRTDWKGTFHQLDITEELPAKLFTGVDVVLHVAGKAHALAEATQQRDEYFRVNTLGTRHVLEASEIAGARRFVFFSTVKAMGECNGPGPDARPLDENADCNPQTEYGHSKLAAEHLVVDGNYVPEPVVLRLCMLYGGKGKGNLSRMILAVAKNLFPPIPEFGNRRSIVHVEDVVNAAMLSAVDPRAVGKTYIVTDGRAYSTKQMYDMIRTALGKRPATVSLRPWMLRWLGYSGDLIASVTGKRFVFDSDVLQKLCGNALYSSQKIHTELGFVPRWDLEKALPHMLEELGL